MGKYEVPEEIRKLKPKGTVIKRLNDKYYVYTQKHIKDPLTNKWKIKSGKCIGKITKEDGFISNEENYFLSDKIVFEFGDYAFLYLLGDSLKKKLELSFDKETSNMLYVLAILCFINGFTSFKDLSYLFEDSFFKVLYPEFSFDELIDALGRKKRSIETFQKSLYEGSKLIYIDGCHINYSFNKKDNNNDKYYLIMGYSNDLNKPVFSEIISYFDNDEIIIDDAFMNKDFKDTLFLIDNQNLLLDDLNLLSNNNNHYLIHKKENKYYNEFKEPNTLGNYFVYQDKKVITPILEELDKNDYLYTFKDSKKYVNDLYEYLAKEGKLNKSISKDDLEEYRNGLGLISFKSNIKMDKEEVFNIYESRWKIDSFYDFLKNKLNIESLNEPDYYFNSALSFIILLISNLYYEVNKKLNKKASKLSSILLDLKSMKLVKETNQIKITSFNEERRELFKSLNLDLNDLLIKINESNKFNSKKIK